MDSPLDDFPSEPTSHVSQFAPVVESNTRKRRSKKRKRLKRAVLAPFRFVRAASIRASRKIAGAATAGAEQVLRLSTWIRSRRSTLAAPASLDEEITHIAHDAGLTQDVAVSSLQRTVAKSLERATSRLTSHEHRESSVRMMALAVTAALIAGVTYGIMWQRPWIVSPAVGVSEAGVSAEATSPPDAIRAVSEPTVTPASQANPAISETPAENSARRDVRRVVSAQARIGQLPILGQLQIVTEPPGARVTVDGVGRGVTPVTIRHLPPGTKRVRVTKDGYAGAERVVSFGQNEAGRTVRIPLERR